MMGKIIQSIFIAFILSGCSVFMAATGSDPVDLSKIQVGAHRSVVESQLGKPITFYRNPGGDYAVYQIITGVEPDYKRAAAYAVLTGLTLGLSEFATFPTEALQGEQNRFEIVYSPSGNVISYKHLVREAPMPNPSEVIENNLRAEQKDI